MISKAYLSLYGVCSTTILYKALKNIGAIVDYRVPDRIIDGYGINVNIIDEAIKAGIDTIITCDNGISAIEQINYAKSKGLTVIVTDHHDVPYIEENNERKTLVSNADAIINPKQEECRYPFKLLCGAGVAYKFVELLYKKIYTNEDFPDMSEFKHLMAIATVGDVVDLKDENRMIVKYGLKTMKNTSNWGIRALAEECMIELANINSYSIGFVMGPCLNASGRLETANKAIELLLSDSIESARSFAIELKKLNEDRKSITEKETKNAIEIVENTDIKNDDVFVIYLPECHESIAGIIAGRIKEKYYKPTFVITNSEDGAKGSGRSIEGYNMFEEITKCRDLLGKFGGHPMAAGLSLPIENIDIFRKMLNENSKLTEKELTPTIWIDVPMPFSYVNFQLIEQLERLEPFGKGNEKPTFATKGLRVVQSYLIGKNKNVLKLLLEDENRIKYDAISFKIDGKKIPDVNDYLAVVYYPGINEYKGERKIQFIINEWNVL